MANRCTHQPTPSSFLTTVSDDMNLELLIYNYDDNDDDRTADVMFAFLCYHFSESGLVYSS